MKIDPTVERLDFEKYTDSTSEHLHRYAITHAFIENKSVLDIASGEGYGSYLISQTAKKVYGVDINKKSIDTAKKKYKKSNLTYLVGNATEIPLPDNSVDVTVSFETIEHHDKHEEMFLEIKRVLKPNGTLIISSPDKEFYSDKTGYNNKYHIKELYLSEFKYLVNSNFKYADFYFQNAFNLNSCIAQLDVFKSFKVFYGNENSVDETFMDPIYNISIASDFELLELSPSIFDGSKIAEKRINDKVLQEVKKVKKSISFKLGQLILKPIKFLK